MNIKNMHCEYKNNPLGIDTLRPRLSWEIGSVSRGTFQRAYRIIAAKNQELLKQRESLLWDSGKVETDESIQSRYDGPPLQSRQRVYWRVKVWDNQNKAGYWSPIAWFEMGLLNPEDWHASWIESGLVGDAKTPAPCPFFQKGFTLNRRIIKARLYITALGLYEAYINGERVGNDVFTPGWTNYDKRVHYQTYDIAQYLINGENYFTAVLGDGWYCGHLGWEARQNYGDRPRLLAQLEIDLSDGTNIIIPADHSWMTRAGPILGSDLIMGEDYDARDELDLFSPVGVMENDGQYLGRWVPVNIFPHPRDLSLVAQNAPPIRVQGEITPVDQPVKIRTSNGICWIFDFGQNLVGRVRLSVVGERGQRIIMKFGEMLTEDGSLYTENLRKARQTDTYILRGDKDGEDYESRFTYHGFRYVQVEGFRHPPFKDLLTAVVLHSDNEPALRFLCSNTYVNQLQQNIMWGWKGNSLDIPSDCPQRDERLGWTGDAQVFVKTATYLSKSASFFGKWVQDMADAQFDYGAIPAYAPFVSSNSGGDGGPAWSDAFIIVPWTIWQLCGDSKILETHYEAMGKYMDYLVKNSPGMIRLLPNLEEVGPGNEEMIGGYGDWLAMDGSGDRRGGTPRELIGTAFLAYDASLMAQIAGALNKPGDSEKYARIFKSTREAFQDHFIGSDGLVNAGTQTAYVLALHFNLIPEECIALNFGALVKAIEDNKIHLTTGFVGTPYLCEVLSNGGRLDLAYALLLQRTYPSWLYPILHGATTIWERWDGWTDERGFQDPNMNSFNHYAYGAVGAWLVERVAGIRPDPAVPGFKQFHLQPGFPIFSQEEGGERIFWVDAEYQSPYGLIKSFWQMDGFSIAWNVVIPPNTSAILHIPQEVRSPVTDDGVPLQDVEGISWLKLEKDALMLMAKSGIYNLKIELRTRSIN